MKARPAHHTGPPWVDVLVVVALLTASLAEIWLSDDPAAGGFGGPRLVATVVAALTIAPLLVRSRWPVAAAATVLAACAAHIALVAPEQAGFEPFVALVLALYSAGAHAPTAASAAVLGATVAGGLGTIAVGAGPADGIAPGLVWIAAAWAFGRVVRARDQRTLELEDLAAQLAIEREERARAAVVGERARIARELHDVVAHNLSVMVVHAGAGVRVLEGDQPIVRDALATIETVGRQTVDEMRRLLGILRRDEELSLAPQPTLAHVEALVDHVRDAGLPVELSVDGDRDGLPAGVDLAGYRIVQEALTNALKHADGAHAWVHVRYDRDLLDLEVRDDGVGPEDGGSGHGLVGMRERVALYGGELETGPTPAGGYRVRARLPLGGSGSA